MRVDGARTRTRARRRLTRPRGAARGGTADIKMNLQETDYGDFLRAEAGMLTPQARGGPRHERWRVRALHAASRCGGAQVLERAATARWVEEFTYIRGNASEPLASFLDLITCVRAGGARARRRRRVCALVIRARARAVAGTSI